MITAATLRKSLQSAGGAGVHIAESMRCPNGITDEITLRAIAQKDTVEENVALLKAAEP